MNKNKFKKNMPKTHSLKGMTFLEAIIGMFIFTLIMFAVTNIFTTSFGGYKKAQRMAENIENAQYAMNLMAKSIRTTRLFGFGTGGALSDSANNAEGLYGYNFSTQECQWFGFVNGLVHVGTGAELDPASCSADYNTYPGNSITGQYIEGSFSGSISVSPDPDAAEIGSVGRVTIKMRVCSSDNCAGDNNDEAFLQTTVSLRDYSTVGL